MTSRDARAMVACLLWILTFCPVLAVAEPKTWKDYSAAGKSAYQQGRYTEAEKLSEAALKVAEGFGPQDPRLATSLNNLAALYNAKGKYAEAELLHERAIQFRWQFAQVGDQVAFEAVVKLHCGVVAYAPRGGAQ